MIAVIDYGTGNIRSVLNAFGRLGCEPVLTSDPAQILAADHVILPGVGDCSVAMHNLRESGIAEIVPQIQVPVLGICVGVQMMCRHSEEGDADCLDIFHTDVVKFTPAPGLKIPHMGWDRISSLKGPLFKGLDEGAFVYYVHSYCPGLCDDTIAVSEHGLQYSGALGRGNFYGCQFHPEKSAAVGEAILKNFLAL